MDRRIDICVALAFALFGLFLILGATSIPLGLYKDPVGPRKFFYVFGGIMAVGGLFVAAQGWRRLRADGVGMDPSEGTPDELGYPGTWQRGFALIGASIVYALLFQPLGYLLATPLYIMAALVVLGQRQRVAVPVVAAAFTILAYLVFAHVLDVRIPVGPFTTLFRDLGWIYL